VQGGDQLLRHRRPRDVPLRDPQVRVALRPDADRAVARGEAALPRPLADQLRRSDLVPGAHPPGAAGPGRAAVPGRGDRRRALGEAPAARLPAVSRRGPRLSGGREHRPQLRGGALVLRSDLRVCAGRRDRAGEGRVPRRRSRPRERGDRVIPPFGAIDAATEAGTAGSPLEPIAVVLLLLVAATALALLARRIGIPYPILLVLGGLSLGFVPGLPRIELEPDLVFL